MFIIIGDFSRKMFSLFIKYKNEALEVFKGPKANSDNETGKRLKGISTDNDIEYINGEFQMVLRKHQTSVPYLPEQNDVAERANRTIIEKKRLMLNDVKLN